jgi:hypothetical protein
MSKQPIKTIPLDNGLNIEFLDFSRKIAGDRWRVEFVARILIPIRDHWLEAVGTLPVTVDALKQVLGDTVQFEYRNVRNFVDQGEKQTLFEQMQANFNSNLKPYCNHPAFAGRFILKEYQTRQRKPGT